MIECNPSACLDGTGYRYPTTSKCSLICASFAFFCSCVNELSESISSMRFSRASFAATYISESFVTKISSGETSMEDLKTYSLDPGSLGFSIISLNFEIIPMSFIPIIDWCHNPNHVLDTTFMISWSVFENVVFLIVGSDMSALCDSNALSKRVFWMFMMASAYFRFNFAMIESEAAMSFSLNFDSVAAFLKYEVSTHST